MPRLTAYLTLALVGGLTFAAPARAECPIANPTHFDSCGPTFTLPAWGDAAGWDDPSQYSTIQLADVNGDGKDELLGRGDAGIQIWTFDTSVGQWRPQLDANALPQILTDFRSPLPSEDTLGWNDPKYYATIQTVDLDGNARDEVIARFPDGMRAYAYEPPAGGTSIDGGTWRTLATGGPFSDDWGWTDAQYYLTIKATDATPQGRQSYLLSHQTGGTIAYVWRDGEWAYGADSDTLKGCSDPACYASWKVTDSAALLAGDPSKFLGQQVFHFAPRGGWDRYVSGGARSFEFESGPLSKDRREDDCPLPGTDVCLPEAAALYETVRVADLAGNLNLQLPLGTRVVVPGLVALSPRGLLAYVGLPGELLDEVVWRWLPATLADLAYPDSEWSSNPGKGGSLLAANIDGQGGEEILALQDGALRAWNLDPDGRGWSRLSTTTPLALSDPSVWNKDASHYATFRAGDVDGDGRDDVIARGPFGIRTWFWNRRGTGGWERYLPADYPAFSGGQATAFAKLTELAKAGNVIPPAASSVRAVWTGENPPSQADLAALQQGVLSIAQCSGLRPGLPPSYTTCATPVGVTFSVADWTAVINEVLAEIFAAEQVNAHFSDLDAMREKLFLAEGAELPAIGSDLRLQAASDTEADFDKQEFWSHFLELAGALAGTAFEPAGAALEAAGLILAMVPSATPSTTTEELDKTYSEVQQEFARSVGDAIKAQAVLSQEVRQDYRLLTVVARLRQQGTWKPDLIGVSSVGNQAFTAWVYKSMLPEVYDRYEITDCLPGDDTSDIRCNGPSSSASYPGVAGSANGPNFTVLGQPPQKNWSPCTGSYPITCDYTGLPSELNERVFGAVSPQCDYRPGNAATAWTFGCNLGLSAQTTVGPLGHANGWNFFTCYGSPEVFEGRTCGRTSVRTTQHVLTPRSRARVSGVLRVPRGFRFRRARAVAMRVLYEPLGRKELAAPAQTRASRPGGNARAARSARRPRARVRLRRLGPTRLRFDIRARRRGVRVPHACAALTRSVQPRPPIARLETRLRVSDGRRSTTHVVASHVACRRDRFGNVKRLRVVRSDLRRQLRPGLRSSLRLPAAVRPGAKALVRVRLRNARGRASGSPLWHLTVVARRVKPRLGANVSARKTIRKLDAGRSRTVRLRIRVPRSASGRFCVRTTTIADLARASSRRGCTTIRRPVAGGASGDS